MRKYVPRFLNRGELDKLGGRYEGVIQQVDEAEHRNPYTCQRELNPVLTFTDGWRLIPNRTMVRALIAAFTHDDRRWIGRRVVVELQKIEHTHKGTGEIRSRWQRVAWAVDNVDRQPDTADAELPAPVVADILSGRKSTQ